MTCQRPTYVAHSWQRVPAESDGDSDRERDRGRRFMRDRFGRSSSCRPSTLSAQVLSPKRRLMRASCWTWSRTWCDEYMDLFAPCSEIIISAKQTPKPFMMLMILIGVHYITRITGSHVHCFSDPRFGALSPTKLRVRLLKLKLCLFATSPPPHPLNSLRSL